MAILSSFVAVVLIGFTWRAPEGQSIVAGKKENNPPRADGKKNDSDKRAKHAGNAANSKPGKETKVEKAAKSVNLKPGIPIDERKVVVPTTKKFNNRNVNETAEWIIARTLQINQHRDNAFRMKNEYKALNEQMKALVGKHVEWRFKVRDILEDTVRVYETWSTFDGSKYPDDPDNRLFKSKSLIIVPRLRVSFYHVGRELFDRITGPSGGDGMRGRIDEPGAYLETSGLFREKIPLARQMWRDDGLVINDEMGSKQAAALRPNDVIIVHAKIKAFRIEDDLLSTGFPSNCAVCILEAKKTDEYQRHVDGQRERIAKRQRELKAKKIREASEKKKMAERLARQHEKAKKDKRAKDIARYWGAITEWREEIQRTGGKYFPAPSKSSAQWERKWREKWHPIPTPQSIYPPQAIAELRKEEQRRGEIASDEYIKKWREKWDKVAFSP